MGAPRLAHCIERFIDDPLAPRYPAHLLLRCRCALLRAPGPCRARLRALLRSRTPFGPDSTRPGWPSPAVKLMKKKGKKGPAVTKLGKALSFFNFFSPPKVPDVLSREDAEVLEEAIEIDFEARADCPDLHLCPLGFCAPRPPRPAVSRLC